MKTHLLILIALLGNFYSSAQKTYCIPDSIDECKKMVYNFEFGEIKNNNTWCASSKYTNFPDTGRLKKTFKENVAYPIYLKSDYTLAGLKATFRVWFDINNDTVFSLDELIWVSATRSKEYYDTIALPYSEPYVQRKRIRVNAFWTDTGFDPCRSYDGEVEDYTVHLDSVFHKIAGVEKSYKLPKISIYPNPAQNSIFISTVGEIHTITYIASVTGEIVIAPTDKKEIIIESLPPGVYFVNVRIGDRTRILKLVKY